METTTTRRKWTWIGHTMRKVGSSITKKALRWIPQGCRDRGRPKNTWKRTVEKELGSMKLSWSEEESKAQDLGSGGVSSAACAAAGVEGQRRRTRRTELRRIHVITCGLDIFDLLSNNITVMW